MQKYSLAPFFDFGIQQMLNILIAKLTFLFLQKFFEIYVKLKSEVKPNLLVIVIDYFKKVHLECFERKKRCPKSSMLLF